MNAQRQLKTKSPMPPAETKMLDAALDYAAKGWPVFPCNSKKEPITARGVLDATTDPKQIAEWWAENPRANIALDVGTAGMMVLDLDPGHSMEELEANVGPNVI